MIFDQLAHSAVYESLHPLFKQAFDYIKTHDLSQLQPGKIELDGSKLYVNIQEPAGKTRQQARLETHRNYIDIQVCLEGKESIGWRDADDCRQVTESYNPDRDIAFFGEQPTCYVDMIPGDFCILYPGDAHAPCIGEGKIKKAIVKVLI